MRELIIKLKVFILRMLFNPLGEKYFIWYKKAIENSIVFQKDYMFLTDTNMKEKLANILNNKSKHENSPVYKTNDTIRFGACQFGEMLTAFRKPASKPDHVVFEHFEQHLFTIYTYRGQFFGRKVRRTYFFCDGELFLGEVIIPVPTRIHHPSDTSILTDLQIKTAIIADLFSSFHVDSRDHAQDFFTIKNNDNTLVQFFDSGFTLQVKYFSSKNQKLYETLVRLYHTQSEPEPSNMVIFRSFLSGDIQEANKSFA